MVEERERACDEEVLSLRLRIRDYAEGILNVCRLYVESPLGLRRRSDGIRSEEANSGDSHRSAVAGDLNVAKKVVLAVVGIAAFAAPIVVGVWMRPRSGLNPRLSRAAPNGQSSQQAAAKMSPKRRSSTRIRSGLSRRDWPGTACRCGTCSPSA